jgi:AraC-like DNA-binding protein
MWEYQIGVYSKNDEVIGIMGTIRYISATQINNGKQDTNSFIHKVLNFIANNVGENLTVHSMALHFNLSVRSFEKKFLDYMKVSPKLFIIKYKISKACDDLIKYGNISQAAIENGFYDQSSFTNQFKKHMGVTPLQYIKRYRK